MTQASPSQAYGLDVSGLEAHRHAMAATLADHAHSIKSVAQDCDSVCLKVGTRLSDAVPTLNTLSSRFATLSATLETGSMSVASSDLGLVAEDVRNIGLGLTREGVCLEALIKLNLVLSHRIAIVADDVRFLVAMVSNAKVELASIEDQGEGLASFGQALEDLARKADGTLREYRSTHGTLLGRLRKAAKVHGDFEDSHRDRLTAVAGDIDFSVSTFGSRHKMIGRAAAEIGRKSQTIGMQIAQSMMALQIGDSTRQRIEHANEALLLACERMDGGGPEFDDPAGEGWGVVSRICRLQQVQIAAATNEFKTDIAKTESLLSQIATSADGLLSDNNSLFKSDDRVSVSFLGDLEPKLKMAEDLIKQCRQSRVTVDGIADMVISTFEDLDRLAASVANMVIDMTIIGTNAIVKAYRLGQRGAGLSIIAQHLRSHALKVADGIKLLTPAMSDARSAAQAFIEVSHGQDSKHMEALAVKTTEVVAAFTTIGLETTQAMQHLEKDIAGVGVVLREALTNLDVIAAYDVHLGDVIDQIGDMADGFDDEGASIGDAEDEALDQTLKPNYTMASERSLHTDFFNAGAPAFRSNHRAAA